MSADPMHTKAYTVSMTVHAEEGTTVTSIVQFMRELEWVGGNRDPDNDPLFSSVSVSHVNVSRRREHDRKPK